MCGALHGVIILLTQVVLFLLHVVWIVVELTKPWKPGLRFQVAVLVQMFLGGSENLLSLHAFAHMPPPRGMHLLFYILVLRPNLLPPGDHATSPCLSLSLSHSLSLSVSLSLSYVFTYSGKWLVAS